MVPYLTMTTVVSMMSLILPTLLPLILMDHYIHCNRSLGDRLHILRAKIFLTQRLTHLILDYPHTLHQGHTLIMFLPSSHQIYLVAITRTQLHTPHIRLKNLALIMSLQKSLYVPTPSLILQRRVNQKVCVCVCVCGWVGGWRGWSVLIDYKVTMLFFTHTYMYIHTYNDTDEQFNFLSKTFVKDSLRTVDKVLEQHQKDIHIMRHKPRRGGKIPTHKKPGMSEENKQKLQVPLCHHVCNIVILIVN